MATIQNNSANPQLCCRACLRNDSKLYGIREYKLSDTFYRVSGTPVYADKLPQHVCAYCLKLLLKCINFRKMCLDTHERFRPLLKGEVNQDFILKMDRPSRWIELSATEIEAIDHTEAFGPEEIKDPLNLDNTINETDVKIEFDDKNDQVKIDDTSALNGTNDIKIISSNTEIEKMEERNDYGIINDIIIPETELNVKLEIETEDEADANSAESEYNPIKEEKRMKRVKKMEKLLQRRKVSEDNDEADVLEDNSGTEKKRKMIDEDPANDNTTDYDVEINLSKVRQ